MIIRNLSYDDSAITIMLGGFLVTQIKIVGDIWTGKYQPALTGNRIVDTGLLTQFCVKLAAWLAQQNIRLSVKIEHEFSLSKAVKDDTLYLIDSNIVAAYPESSLSKVNYLPIKHQNFLHGNPSSICRSVLEWLKVDFKQQS